MYQFLTVRGYGDKKKAENEKCSSADPPKKVADKFKAYVAKPEVKEIYAAMKTGAEINDAVRPPIAFLQPENI